MIHPRLIHKLIQSTNKQHVAMILSDIVKDLKQLEDLFKEAINLNNLYLYKQLFNTTDIKQQVEDLMQHMNTNYDITEGDEVITPSKQNLSIGTQLPSEPKSEKCDIINPEEDNYN